MKTKENGTLHARTRAREEFNRSCFECIITALIYNLRDL